MIFHTIDLHFFTPQVIAVYVIESSDGLILIETGPDSVFHNLEKGLDNIGASISDVRYVFLTHIHLDHGGAAWKIAEKGAQIYVHPFGATHLADPSKLLSSAERIYGDQMKTLWGEIKPISSDRLHPTNDGEVYKMGSISIRCLETPGHASHHNVYSIDGIVFTGDVGGIRIENGPIVPPTPPPDVNVELWQQSLKKIKEIKPEKLYPTHFGETKNPIEHFDELEDRLLEWSDLIGRRLKEGKTDGEIVQEFKHKAEDVLARETFSEAVRKAYEFADPMVMNVMGLLRYWRKYRL